MYHFDAKNLVAAIKALADEKIINEIENYVKSRSQGSISLCYPTIGSQKNVLHFVIDGDKNLSLGTKAEISAFIKNKINYEQPYELDEEYLIVLDRELFKQEVYSQRFSDVTPYSVGSFQNIVSFFSRHYSHLSPDLKTFLDDHEEVSSEDFYELVKNNPKIYNFLKRSPEKLTEIVEPLKKKLIEDQQVNNSSVADARRSIPVK